MAKCKEIVALLSDYLDRDLPPETCRVVEEHLSSCAECGEEAESLKRTLLLCRQYRTQNRPDPLAADKHRELVDAFQRVLSSRHGESGQT